MIDNKKDKVIDNHVYELCPDPTGKMVTTRELQEKLLIIMDEIHRICTKNDIPYGLIAGSALGIYNYGGFIPWDDDMDICVPCEYWDQFVEAMYDDLDESRFYFHCFENDDKYNILLPDMKIRMKDTYCYEKNNRWMPNRCDGNGIFIDVMKYVHVSEDKELDQYYRNLVKKKILKLCADNLCKNNNVELKEEVKGIADRYSDVNKNSKLISQAITFPWEKPKREPIFNIDDVYPFKLYPFEGRLYYSYNNLENVLRKWYGDGCFKQYDEEKKEWYDPYPMDKRRTRHCKYINLNADYFKRRKKRWWEEDD